MENLEHLNQASQLNVETIKNTTEKIKTELKKVIVGQEEMIDLLIAAIYTGGHVLIEGVPGIAKTLTINLLAKCIDLEFKRIQFTPDLMPADVTGTTIFNSSNSNFEFKQGPIFSNFVLIDEINRSPAKTQAALFEVMEEQQVTADGKTYKMKTPFMVLATQNPVEQEGTYKLPEAQQDRFIFKIIIDYPSLEEEILIINKFERDFTNQLSKTVEKVVDISQIIECKSMVEKIYIKPELVKYIAEIVNNTRNNRNLFLGASPRASLSILKTSKALAAMNGRYFVTPDDIKHSLFHVLNHRVVLSPDKEMEGYTLKEILNDIIASIEVPR